MKNLLRLEFAIGYKTLDDIKVTVPDRLKNDVALGTKLSPRGNTAIILSKSKQGSNYILMLFLKFSDLPTMKLTEY